MLFAAIASFIASVACLIGSAIGMERRSKAADANFPSEMFTSKTYQPAPPQGLSLPLSVLVLGFVFFATGLVLIFLWMS